MSSKKDHPPRQLPAYGTIATAELTKSVPKEATVAVVPVLAGGDADATVSLPGSLVADERAAAEIVRQLEVHGATGALGEVHALVAPESATKKGLPERLVAVGLGEERLLPGGRDADEGAGDRIRRAAGEAARAVAKGATGPVVVATTLGDWGIREAVEGWILGSYTFRGERGAGGRTVVASPGTGRVQVESHVAVLTEKRPTTREKEELVRATIIAESVAFARDLVNTPANVLNPEAYANELAGQAEFFGLDSEILDETELHREGFGGVLAVGGGSERPPRVVCLSWKPRKAKRHVALVGKGITFDTGGISLKPASGMEKMISDMGGSAAAAAAAIAAARLNLPIQVTATLPLAENMPSGKATRPGDVVTHYGGITTEILNTDAEGRLVLADAIARASEDEPDFLLETATLTGAQITALGNHTAGVMGSEEFRDRVAQTGRREGERAWAMPLLEEHTEELASPIADIRNHSNSRDGGMLYAGRYLEQFVGEGIQWAHVDVAGPSWNDKGPSGYTPSRATGVPARTFIAVLEELAEES